ncbi:MAG: hypothetical protein JXA99_13405 [Candidatus Lokiarchaeota archaeon]|nr:hypothetical protein [Candidatus Lokiarchaeota archaeon]
MAELLRLGYTMLNEACPKCNTPIFRNKNGEMICPSCNRKVVIMKENINSISDNTNIEKKQNLSSYNNKILDSTYKILENKIYILLEKIEKENEITKIREYVGLLKELYEILKIIGLI